MDSQESPSVPQSKKITLPVLSRGNLLLRPGDNAHTITARDLTIPAGFVGIAQRTRSSPGQHLTVTGNVFKPASAPRVVHLHNNSRKVLTFHCGAVLFVVHVYRVKSSTTISSEKNFVLQARSSIFLTNLNYGSNSVFAVDDATMLKNELHTFLMVVAEQDAPFYVYNTHSHCAPCHSCKETYPFVHTHGLTFRISNPRSKGVVVLKSKPVAVVYKLYEQLFHLDGPTISSLDAGPQIYIYPKYNYTLPGDCATSIETAFECRLKGHRLWIEGTPFNRSRVARRVYQEGPLTLTLFNSTTENEHISASIPVARALVVTPRDQTVHTLKSVESAVLLPGQETLLSTNLPSSALTDSVWLVSESENNVTVNTHGRIIHAKGVSLWVTNCGTEALHVDCGFSLGHAHLALRNPLLPNKAFT